MEKLFEMTKTFTSSTKGQESSSLSCAWRVRYWSKRLKDMETIPESNYSFWKTVTFHEHAVCQIVQFLREWIAEQRWNKTCMCFLESPSLRNFVLNLINLLKEPMTFRNDWGHVYYTLLLNWTDLMCFVTKGTKSVYWQFISIIFFP